MSFKDRKRDDHGHVIGNDEVDGQECQHVNGGSKLSIDYNEIERRKNAPENQKQKFLETPEEIEANLEEKRKNTDSKLAEKLRNMVENFDDDYDEEFNEPSSEDERQYVDKCMADIAKAADKKAFEYVSGNIDDLTEAGLISEETSDRLYAELDKKIDEVNNDIDKDLMDAINNADDDVLDKQFGKDTPERKLAGAIKGPAKEDDLGKIQSKNNPQLTREKILHEGWKRNVPQDKIAVAISKELGISLKDAKEYVEKESKLPEAIDFDEWIENNKEQLGKPEDFAKKTAKMPNGKEMSLFDFAHNIVNYLDTDTAATIIASKYGVSEADAKAYLESSYNREGSKEDYERKLKNSRG